MYSYKESRKFNFLFFIYLCVKWSRPSHSNLEADLYEKLKRQFLASQQTDALQI